MKRGKNGMHMYANAPRFSTLSKILDLPLCYTLIQCQVGDTDIGPLGGLWGAAWRGPTCEDAT